MSKKTARKKERIRLSVEVSNLNLMKQLEKYEERILDERILEERILDE